MNARRALYAITALMLLSHTACALTPAPFWEKNLAGKINSLSSDDGVIVAASEQDRVHALNTRGRILWTYETRHGASAASARGGVVAAASLDGIVHVLNSSGQLECAAQLPTYVGFDGALLARADGVLAGGMNGVVYKLGLDCKLLWNASTDAYVTRITESAGEVIVVSDRQVYKVAESGLAKAFDAGGFIRSSSAEGGRVALGLSDGTVRLHESGGRLLWQRKLPEVAGALHVSEGRVSAGTRGNQLAVFDLSGKQLYSTDLGDSVVAVNSRGKYTAASTLNSHLILLNEYGIILWDVKTRGRATKLLLGVKHLTCGTDDGFLHDFILPERSRTKTIFVGVTSIIALFAAFAVLVKGWKVI